MPSHRQQATSTKAQALKKKGGSRPQALLYVFKPQAARIQAQGTRLKVRSSLCKLQDIFSLIKFYGTRTEGFLQDESIARMFHMKRKLMRTEGRFFTFTYFKLNREKSIILIVTEQIRNTSRCP